ncbi:MAG: type II secretion system F family protein [Thermofilum sp.]
MGYIPVKGRTALLLAALSLALGSSPLAVLAAAWGSLGNTVEQAELLEGLALPWSLPLYTLLGLALPLALAPLAYVYWNNSRYTDALAKQLPTFFKGVADGVRAGMTLDRALATSAEAVGDPLRSEVQNILTMLSLGVPFREALSRATERVPVPVFRRAASLLAAAYESGGRVADVLGAAAEMYGMLRGYEEERKARMATYIWVTYIALAVFLITATIITSVFVGPLYTLRAPGLVTPPPPHLFKAGFFIAAYMQAIFGGLISGKISRGTVKAGVTHTMVMTLAVVAYFNVQEIFLEPLLTPQL